jgi:alkanesulfonate monooxygenase SsuD/methylene tetrahydromethanopterin reductase-like flavin-dependent oxidoreductase (luciferase family)
VVRKDVIILRDADRACRLGDNLIAGGYRGFPREAVAYGSVDQVVEQLQPYRELGYEGVMIRCMGIPQVDALETLELAGEVRIKLTG